MGILDRLGLGRGTRDMLAGPVNIGTSPWSTATLSPIVASDLAAMIDPTADALPLSRSQAIRIPAVSKARNLLVSTIPKFPLRALTGSDTTATLAGNQPTFLTTTDTNYTPHSRMAWTIDDAFFYGFAAWFTRRGAADKAGRREILAADWCPASRVSFENGLVMVDREPVDDSELILFDFPFEGMLNVAATTMRGARDQEAAWVGRARNPIPVIELHVTEECELTDDQIAAFVESWSKARRSVNGAIGYTPKGLTIITHGEVKADLMVEGRNSVRTDIGSFANIRASMLDGTSGIDSLTYATKDGERNSFYEFDLPFWIDPIAARLSMDDVLPHGQYMRFDKYEALNPPTPTGPTVKD